MPVANYHKNDSMIMNDAIIMDEEGPKNRWCINDLTKERRERFNMKNPEGMYFVVRLPNDSYYKIKLKTDFCLCLLDQFHKQKSKSKHRIFMELYDKYGLPRTKGQNQKCKENSSKNSDGYNQSEFYVQKKSLPFGSYTKTSIAREFVKALDLEKDWHIGYSLTVVIDYEKFWPNLLDYNTMYDLSNLMVEESMRILNQRGFKLKMQPNNMKCYLKSLASRSKLGLVKRMRELGNALSFKN